MRLDNLLKVGFFVLTLFQVGSALAIGTDPRCLVLNAAASGEPRAVGEAMFRQGLGIFSDPAQHLRARDFHLEATPEENVRLIRAAFERLSQGDPANASHVQEHLVALQNPRVAAALEAAGLNSNVLLRNALLHDLGKQYGSLPAEFRAFLESIFPVKMVDGKDVNFLPRVIMSHEFGSMVMVRQMARELGIPEEKVNRLNALFAGHNAGYDPNLPGFHFWVQPFAWGNFARAMRAAGIDVPETYRAVLSRAEGGRAETIILTAIDRATSLSLASQEKFSTALISQGKWNNEALSKSFADNAQNVPAEVANVLERLDGFYPPEQARAIRESLNAHFSQDRQRLTDVGAALARMGTDAPRGAGMTEAQTTTSVAYRTRTGQWYRVTSTGQVYQHRGGTWTRDAQLSAAEGTRADVPGILFRRIIFPDVNYQVPQLQLPVSVSPRVSSR